MKNILIILLLWMACQSSFAQDAYQPDNVTFYYNIKWELTTPEKSTYKRVAQFDLYNMVFDGVYKDYDKAGRLIGDGYYDHGKLTSFQTEYFESGAVKLSVEYNGKDFTIWQLAKNDVNQNELAIARGTGTFTMEYFYFFDWKLKRGMMTGEFRNGERYGTWVYLDAANKITDREVYANGKLLSHVFFQGDDSVAVPAKKEIILSVRLLFTELQAIDWNSYSSLNQYIESQVQYPPDFQRPISYSGGIKRLLLLLAQQVSVPDKNLVLVRLKIDEHGIILKSSVARSVDDDTDGRALKAIENHRPYFLPPIKGGKPYATTVYIPIGGGDEWVEAIHNMPVEWFLDVNNFY
ncbi:MAG: hypothetical protein JST43_10625 [Bacteroidetes bacterium]|nr:hypothetical protein [Bacteroidota bacterium]MBS1540164.1 hypothetical protein [Bacteroidota bacterium]